MRQIVSDVGGRVHSIIFIFGVVRGLLTEAHDVPFTFTFDNWLLLLKALKPIENLIY